LTKEYKLRAPLRKDDVIQLRDRHIPYFSGEAFIGEGRDSKLNIGR